ncbi:MAG TPA: OsmC family protein [Burkholderiaceae bacterium]|nr:OsmC family protein [Burkholderiaceae bacterium]
MRRSFVDDLQAHDQRERTAQLRRALLVMHAPGDTVVDISNATTIFQAAHHPKSFVSLDDADHLLTRASDAEYAARVIAAWAARYVGHGLAVRSGSDKEQVIAEETGEGGLQVEVHAGGVRLVADEPVDAGGMGSGPTPYDLLCAALGACTVMTLRLYARRKGWPLANVRVSVGHVRAATTPPDTFKREIELVGELTAEQRSRLMEMAGRCPVHATLERGSRVETKEVSALQPMLGVETADRHVHDIESAAQEGERGQPEAAR